MNVLISNTWIDKYLDYSPFPGSVCINVSAIYNVAPITSQFVKVPRSFRLLYDYIFKVGVKQVILKVKSRLAESGRDSKYYSFGFGRVCSQDSDRFPKGSTVMFLAYNHPKGVDRIILDQAFVRKFSIDPDLLMGSIRHFTNHMEDNINYGATLFAAWSPFSGINPSVEAIDAAFNSFLQNVNNSSFFVETAHSNLINPAGRYQNSTYPKNTHPNSINEFTYSIVGYGQYAKTSLKPHLPANFHLTCIYEIDPVQIGPNPKLPFSTDPYPKGIADNVLFIAGFHHTHNVWTIAALNAGSHVVIEKPVVTTFSQFDSFWDIALSRQNKLHSGFHKRYQEFNLYIHGDLSIQLGEPISYYAHVYEIQLPNLHWYNWPNSGSRIISNACHWLDHFMFINDYCNVLEFQIYSPSIHEYLVFVKLENSAILSLVLSDLGTPRLGVREDIILVSRSNRITIKDSRSYIAESSTKTLRRFNVKASEGHRRMYRAICSNIQADRASDSLRSFQSTYLMLCLEQALADNDQSVHSFTFPYSLI